MGFVRCWQPAFACLGSDKDAKHAQDCQRVVGALRPLLVTNLKDPGSDLAVLDGPGSRSLQAVRSSQLKPLNRSVALFHRVGVNVVLYPVLPFVIGAGGSSSGLLGAVLVNGGDAC